MICNPNQKLNQTTLLEIFQPITWTLWTFLPWSCLSPQVAKFYLLSQVHALLPVINSHISLCSLSASGSESDDAGPSLVSTDHFSLENSPVRHVRDVLPQGEARQKLMAFFNKHRPVDEKVRSDHIMLGKCRKSPTILWTTQTLGSRSSLNRKFIIASHRHLAVVLCGRTWRDQGWTLHMEPTRGCLYSGWTYRGQEAGSSNSSEEPVWDMFRPLHLQREYQFNSLQKHSSGWEPAGPCQSRTCEVCSVFKTQPRKFYRQGWLGMTGMTRDD